MERESKVEDLKNTYIKPIIITLVCTFFIVPILTPFFDALKAAGGNFAVAFVDYVYEASAKTTAEAAILFLCDMALRFLAGFLAGITAAKIAELHSEKRPQQDHHTNILNHAGKESPEGLLESINALNTTAEKLKKKKKRINILLIAGYAFLTISCIFIVFFTIFPAQINLSFNQKIDIVSPYVTHETVLQLKSDWARMKSKSDYMIIMDEMTRICSENQLS